MGRPKAEVCPQGHEYTEENSYFHPSRNGRVCRICKREQGRVASKTYREKLRRAAEIRAMFMASQPRERDDEGRLVMIRHDTNDTNDTDGTGRPE
jgi:hypothetical protein